MPSGQGNTSLDPRTTDAAPHTGDSWIFAVISRFCHCADLLVRIREDYASLYRLTVHAKYLLMAAEPHFWCLSFQNVESQMQFHQFHLQRY